MSLGTYQSSPDVGFTHHLIYAPFDANAGIVREMIAGLMIGAIAAALLAWAFIANREKAIDRALNMELHSVIMEARRTLSPEDLELLRKQGRELEDIGRRHVREGSVSAKDADRTTKRAIIQSTYASLEVTRMFGVSKGQSSPMALD